MLAAALVAIAGADAVPFAICSTRIMWQQGFNIAMAVYDIGYMGNGSVWPEKWQMAVTYNLDAVRLGRWCLRCQAT